MDFYWGDTMFVVPWYMVVVAGSLALGVLVAVVALVTGLLGRGRTRT